MALAATWHLSAPVLTCRTEVHVLLADPSDSEGYIWQVAFKSRPLCTALLTGPQFGLHPGGKRENEFSSSVFSTPPTPLPLPLLSFEYAKSALSSRLPLTHQMCARRPVLPSETGDIKKEQHGVTTGKTNWWLMLLLSFVPTLPCHFSDCAETKEFSFLLFSNSVQFTVKIPVSGVEKRVRSIWNHKFVFVSSWGHTLCRTRQARRQSGRTSKKKKKKSLMIIVIAMFMWYQHPPEILYSLNCSQ